MSKFYVVWNPGKTEGFVTNDAGDARYVASGIQPRGAYRFSTAGEAFRETYVDMDGEDDGMELEMQEIDLYA